MLVKLISASHLLLLQITHTSDMNKNDFRLHFLNSPCHCLQLPMWTLYIFVAFHRLILVCTTSKHTKLGKINIYLHNLNYDSTYQVNIYFKFPEAVIHNASIIDDNIKTTKYWHCCLEWFWKQYHWSFLMLTFQYLLFYRIFMTAQLLYWGHTFILWIICDITLAKDYLIFTIFCWQLLN